jgi:opacity protein-like surface antigen
MKKRRMICVGAILVVLFALTQFARAQQKSAEEKTGSFVLGAGLGFHADTPDDTAFAFGITGDYYLTHEFSIGPLLQMGFTEDLFQIGLTAQAKYTFDLREIPQLKPHVQAGLGFIYADLDRSGRKDEDDFSFLIPIGIGAEYQLTKSIWLDTTFLFNITNLDVRDENLFFTWLIGLKFPF